MMQMTRWAWLTMLLLAACGGGDATGTSAKPDWAADDSAIRAAIQSSQDAWNRGDLDGHLAFYDPGVTFMTRDGPRPGVDGIRKAFSEKYFLDGKPKQALRLDEIAVRALDDDAAIATGRFKLSGGGQPEQTGRFTTVWVRRAEGWRAVHDHSN